MSTRRPIWRYGLFQIPALLSVACLLAAGITHILGLGCQDLWPLLFIGLSIIAFMWMIVMPIDHYLRLHIKLTMSLAGRIAILNAFFWTALLSIWLVSTLPPLMNQCAISEQVNLDWSQWRANIWNEMFLDQDSTAPLDSEADFSFVVTRDRRIRETQILTSEPELESYVQSRIESLEGKPVLSFVPGTRRDEVTYESSVQICTTESKPGCGDPADPDSYPDTEEYER